MGEHWSDEYMTLIEDCEKRECRLSDWEVNFIDSLKRAIESGRRPTKNESDKLDEIWQAATERG